MVRNFPFFMSILEILAEKNTITQEQIPEILEEAENSSVSVEQILLKRGIEAEEILEAKGEFLDIPTRSLHNKEIPGKILEYIPEESVLHYKFVPIGVRDGVLEVGVVDPDNIEARDALNFISTKVKMPFKIFLISESDFEAVVAMYKGLSGEVTQALSELESELTPKPKGADKNNDEGREEENDEGSAEANDLDGASLSDIKDGKGETKIIEDAPVTKIVATILRYATDGNASDIHIERMRENVRVRFRVDGIMNTSLVLPTKIHSAVVARIKILSNMRLDEKRKPQDGRFSAKLGERKIDFRVSTFPTYYGEKVVMRILDQEKGVKGLDKLGLSDRNLKLIRAAIEKPYGLILRPYRIGKIYHAVLNAKRSGSRT